MKQYLILIIAALLYGYLAQAQPQVTLTKDEIRSTLQKAGELLQSKYVFPDVALKMQQALKTAADKGSFDKVNDASALAAEVNKVLQDISKDKHLRFRFAPGFAQELQARAGEPDGAEPAPSPEELAWLQNNNYEFKEVKILPGNIGYIKFDGFLPHDGAKAAATAALNFVANTNAVIFDMRENGGGDPVLVEWIMGYFYEKPTLINTFYNRIEDKTSESYTVAEVKGPRLTGADVYILTSSYTFSCAEEFSYDFQCLKRGKIVGEVTGGGAHPTQPFAVNDKFVLGIPFMRAINPVTKTNWEGVGIQPDVRCSAAEALKTAHVQALKDRAGRSDDAAAKADAEWEITRLPLFYDKVEVKADLLQSYAGQYEDRTISFENGKLFSQRPNGRKFELKPISNTLFEIDETARIEFFEGGKYVITHFKGEADLKQLRAK